MTDESGAQSLLYNNFALVISICTHFGGECIFALFHPYNYYYAIVKNNKMENVMYSKIDVYFSKHFHKYIYIHFTLKCCGVSLYLRDENRHVKNTHVAHKQTHEHRQKRILRVAIKGFNQAMATNAAETHIIFFYGRKCGFMCRIHSLQMYRCHHDGSYCRACTQYL